MLAAAGLVLAGHAARAEGDAAAGEKVFHKCAVCHMVGPDAKTKVGPVLNGVFGRTAGTLEGYKYSQAMVEAGAKGLVWTPEVLTEYLPKPKAFIKGTKMAFIGLKDPAEIADVSAYLLTFSPDYKPSHS